MKKVTKTPIQRDANSPIYGGNAHITTNANPTIFRVAREGKTLFAWGIIDPDNKTTPTGLWLRETNEPFTDREEPGPWISSTTSTTGTELHAFNLRRS